MDLAGNEADGVKTEELLLDLQRVETLLFDPDLQGEATLLLAMLEDPLLRLSVNGELMFFLVLVTILSKLTLPTLMDTA